MKKHIDEVLKKLQLVSSKNHKRKAFIKNYMKSGLDFLGLDVPTQRKVILAGYTFSKLSAKDSLKIWNFIFKSSKVFEAMSQPLIHYGNLSKRVDLIFAWPVLKTWVKRVENWAHSDSLSNIYANLLERHPTKIFPTLKKWNKSREPWLRRQSVVSLLYYANLRKKVLPYHSMVKLVSNLLDDSDYYVQKGVGWCLREMGNVYPKQTKSFLSKNLHRLSPVAFTTSIERLSPNEKKKLKDRRAKLRYKK